MKTNSFVLIIIFSTLLISSCKKKDKDNLPLPTLPVLTTDTVTNVTSNTAQSGGKISSDGGSAIIERGVCWGKNKNPSILDYKTIDGNGAGNFKSSLTSLTNNTTYYVRAYSTNSVGTSYGNEMSFSTGTITDIDGNIYHYVTIGSQTWMVENLKTSRYRNGDTINIVPENSKWANLTTGALAHSNNDIGNINVHGKLYNWYAVADTRNICPVGWHIPSDIEWGDLLTSLGGGSIAGGKLKQTGTTNWNDPNTGATNSSGFTGLASGTRDYDGTFKEFKRSAYYWASSETSATNATGWYLFYNYNSVLNGSYSKKDAFIVRCLKD